MRWIIISCFVIILIILCIIKFFLYFYKRRNIGKDFFKESEKPFGKKAPEMYYDKQMMFRKCYGFFYRCPLFAGSYVDFIDNYNYIYGYGYEAGINI